MKRKIIKFISIFLMMFIIINVCRISAQAAGGTDITSKSWNDPKRFDSVTDNSGAGTTARNVVGTIINVIRIVGTGVAIIMLTYVAIKYMTAAPQEKAEFKKSATAYIVGAIVLFGASGILTVVQNFATSNIVTS